MILLWVFGFFLPWIAGIVLWRIDKELMLVCAPIAGLIAFLFNLLGFTLKLWTSVPSTEPSTLFGLPGDIGLYPVSASFLLFAIRKGINPWMAVIGGSLFLTLAEEMCVVLGCVLYGNRWNIGWTFASYLIALLIVLGYVRLLSPRLIRTNDV